MKDCNNYSTCAAPLCPLDPDIHKRTWIMGEDICKAHKAEPWIQRQLKLQRTKPASLLEQPLSLDYLTRTAPKKRTLSPEHKAKLLEASQAHQKGSGRTTK